MRPLLSAVAVLALCGTGAARAADVPSLPDANTALRCAMWSAIMASQQANADDERAFNLVMTWFVGLYEGAAHRKFDGAASGADIEKAMNAMPELNGICVPLMQDFGDRLQAWGNSVEAADSKPAPGA